MLLHLEAQKPIDSIYFGMVGYQDLNLYLLQGYIQQSQYIIQLNIHFNPPVNEC